MRHLTEMGDHRVRFGLQFATAPICSGTRSGYGREIGPRPRGSEIARQCGAAVGQERPSGKPGGLFLMPASYAGAVASRAAARSIISPRLSCAGAIFSFMNARTSGGAVSGEPELNGGAGLYSSRS